MITRTISFFLDTLGKLTASVEIQPDGRIGRHYIGAVLIGHGPISDVDCVDTLRRAASMTYADNPSAIIVDTPYRIFARLSAEVLAALEYFEESSPVLLRVDGGPGQWTGYATYETTGRDIPRDPSEGGTHHYYQDALNEARCRADRLSGREIKIRSRA